MSVFACECARSSAPFTAIEPPPPSVVVSSNGAGICCPTVRRSCTPTCRLRSASTAGGATLLSVTSIVALVSSSASIEKSAGAPGLREAAGGAFPVSWAVFAAGFGVAAIVAVATAGAAAVVVAAEVAVAVMVAVVVGVAAEVAVAAMVALAAVVVPARVGVAAAVCVAAAGLGSADGFAAIRLEAPGPGGVCMATGLGTAWGATAMGEGGLPAASEVKL